MARRQEVMKTVNHTLIFDCLPIFDLCGVPCEAALVDLDRAGETIPIRLFLGGFDLTPTFREVNKKYSTRYYLSLVLIDEGEFF